MENAGVTARIAAELAVRPESVAAVVKLLNEGSTVTESVDDDGNKTVTKTTIITSNEQRKISWKK